ncbi:MAG: hypothetical protein FWH59_04445, partial [Lentimicrobiaceae bacterium]|nr:hypothetical protein [Lentimicrobiaceae bacterium]
MKSLKLSILTLSLIVAGALCMPVFGQDGPIQNITYVQAPDVNIYNIGFVSQESSELIFAYTYELNIGFVEGNYEMYTLFSLVESNPNIGLFYGGAENLDETTLD